MADVIDLDSERARRDTARADRSARWAWLDPTTAFFVALLVTVIISRLRRGESPLP